MQICREESEEKETDRTTKIIIIIMQPLSWNVAALEMEGESGVDFGWKEQGEGIGRQVIRKKPNEREDKSSIGGRRLRSISCGRWRDQTRRILVWRSTSAGKWTGKPRWNRRSRRNICAQEVR